jgi:hypothetical protein
VPDVGPLAAAQDYFAVAAPSRGRRPVPTFATIGYEGKTQSELLGQLESVGVELLKRPDATGRCSPSG